mgnify:CR=1 FL=1
MLEKIIKEDDYAKHVPMNIVKSENDVEDFLENSINSGCEGLMLKMLDKPYQAGARGNYWLKLKREYRNELGDSLDLVVIGAFFGKREFQVRGIGEINKKTVEGTVAVFVSSILGMILVDQFYINQFYDIPNSSSNLNLNTEDHLQLTYKFNKMLVFGLTSLVCMFFEVMAFRGTDNFFLQLSGLIMLLLMKK